MQSRMQSAISRLLHHSLVLYSIQLLPSGSSCIIAVHRVITYILVMFVAHWEYLRILVECGQYWCASASACMHGSLLKSCKLISSCKYQWCQGYLSTLTILIVLILTDSTQRTNSKKCLGPCTLEGFWDCVFCFLADPVRLSTSRSVLVIALVLGNTLLW